MTRSLRRTTPASATQTITVEDTTAPEFGVPADYTVECSDEMPMEDATASDNCSDVSITVESETIAGDAAGNYTIVRTFTATDACGNTSTKPRRSPLNTTNSGLKHPRGLHRRVLDELILDDATASDNCGEVTIEVSSETTAGDCDSSYTVTRIHCYGRRWQRRDSNDYG